MTETLFLNNLLQSHPVENITPSKAETSKEHTKMTRKTGNSNNFRSFA